LINGKRVFKNFEIEAKAKASFHFAYFLAWTALIQRSCEVPDAGVTDAAAVSAEARQRPARVGQERQSGRNFCGFSLKTEVGQNLQN